MLASINREVIRRNPEEFKIACLKDIKALFPAGHSNFYAGFGNRITVRIHLEWEESGRKVGGKIKRKKQSETE